MNNELFMKIQEKLGTVIDIVNFENVNKAYDYAVSYLQTRALMTFIACLIVTIICFLIAFIGTYLYENTTIDIEWLTSIAFVGGCTMILITLGAIYDLIMTHLYLVISVLEWLK